MKKLLQIITLVALLGFTRLNAQIINGSFENWAEDTFYFAAGTYGGLPADTAIFNNPVSWTSSNFLTDLDSLGPAILASQDQTTVMAGHGSSLKLTTDSLHPHIAAIPFPTIYLPGFVVNGYFAFSAITGSLTNITPAAIPGAGQPITERLDSFRGYFNYAPLINSMSGLHDSCEFWATLRNGPNIIANAVFKYADSTAGFQYFSAPFIYSSCDMPDTLVILIASGPPNLHSFLPGGTESITPGSTLWVDSLFYDTLPSNFVFPPFANNVVSDAFTQVPDTINVPANITDCNGPDTITIVAGPYWGTASVLSNNDIVYISSAGYVGDDTIEYQATNPGGDSATALVTIVVQQPQGISNVNKVPIRVYPVPSNGELYIQFENPGNALARIYDILGNLVKSESLNSNTNLINMEGLANGCYNLCLENAGNEIIARSNFIVAK